jgi:hypothetical protein
MEGSKPFQQFFSDQIGNVCAKMAEFFCRAMYVMINICHKIAVFRFRIAIFKES